MGVDEVVDVAVAGAGPAGLAVARMVAALGHSVLIAEREPAIGVPVHTSGATAPSTLARFGLPSALGHPVTTLRFRGPREEAIFTYDAPAMVVLDVTSTYQELASQAVKAGARLLLETSLTAQSDVLAEPPRFLLSNRNGGETMTGQAQFLVDCTGYKASVSKETSLHPGFTRFGVGAEFELIAPHCRQDEAVMVVGSRYAPSGYAWIFPWGEGRVRVGVGVHHSDVRDDPRKLVQQLVDTAHDVGVDLRDHHVVEEHFGLIPAADLPPRLSAGRVVAVGDAACQATLVVGEGIRMALVAGELAGQSISAALASGEGEAIGYDVEFRRSFGRALRIGNHVNRRLSSFDDEEWDEKIRLLAKLPAPVLPALLQSDFSAANIAQIVLRNPMLIARVARYAFQSRA